MLGFFKYSYKDKLKLSDLEKKTDRLQFYDAKLRYVDCMAERKIKDQQIRQLRVNNMHCKLKVVNNQQLNGKYKVRTKKQ